MKKKSFGVAFIFLMSLLPGIATAQKQITRNEINHAIEEGLIQKADSLLQLKVADLIAFGPQDSLPLYISSVGKIAHKRAGIDAAIQASGKFVELLRKTVTNPLMVADIQDFYADYLSTLGKNEMAFNEAMKGLNSAISAGPNGESRAASIHASMGAFASRMGKMNLSQYHNGIAVSKLLNTPGADMETLYVSANNMGTSMWMASKLDSAIYYFDIAAKALEKTERSPLNVFYRPAVLQNNLSALYGMQGKTTAAIDAMKATIKYLRDYLALKDGVTKRESAIEFQFEATDNLAGIYRELGDHNQALDMLQYSLSQKQKFFNGDSTPIFKSYILLGQVYQIINEHNKAKQYLNSGLRGISIQDGDHLFWQADACYHLALVSNSENATSLAEYYYRRADSLYEESLQGEYDDIYMEFLRNSSLFYASNGQVRKGLAKAGKGFEYVKKTQGTNTLLAFFQMLNLGEVSFVGRDYVKALDYSKKSITLIRSLIKTASFALDSIKLELKLPAAILLKVKTEYELSKDRDVVYLTAALNELTYALEILDRRKTVLQDPNDISILMADHSELMEYIKKLNLELYNATKDVGYIERIIGVHETSLYMRIRSRLDKSDSVQFKHVPKDIQDKERSLKANIKQSLEKSSSHNANMQSYFKAVDEWSEFLEMVRKKYPAYYEMRYAKIFRPLKDVQLVIPGNVTLIRYFFIEKELFAMVVDKSTRQFVPIVSSDLSADVLRITGSAMSEMETSDLLYKLYNQLWFPIRQYVRNKKVVIVPDGVLYNLSFEILTPERIRSYKDLAKMSLLSQHSISYHYSLFLVGNKPPDAAMKRFVAFAPGFLDREKSKYLSAVNDSMSIDRGYLRLLPQPFTLAFAGKARKMLGGVSYINEESTADIFRKNAGGHKIIYIGTHAESNNLRPEYSRLIFSKNVEDREEGNSIFLNEIYNCNLTSELAVLTACESGKPGFQDGEGMISLAHAFNYAGSESILTGLWNIDEKSSTMLTDLFYDNLLKGMEKDEALRLAKISYLEHAEGRMLAPQYWSGLILMGDTSPVTIERESSSRTWVMGGLIVLGLLGTYFFYRRTRRSARV